MKRRQESAYPRGLNHHKTEAALPRQRTLGTPTPLAAKTLARLSLLLLLMIDALLLAANVAHLSSSDDSGRILGIFIPAPWNGDYDGSHLEVWGHIQLFAASAILTVLAFSYRSLLLGFWGAILLVIMGDDLIQVHEQVGHIFVRELGLEGAFGLRPQDFGELLVWAILGVVALLVLMLGYAKATFWERKQFWLFIGIMALLAIFAVGLDMLHIILDGRLSTAALHAVTLAETAGEIVPMSLFLALTIKIAVAPQLKAHG